MKPGYKTTEFVALAVGLIAVVLEGLTVSGGVVDYAMDAELLKWWLAGAGAYKISRGMAKSGDPRVRVVRPEPSTA